MRGEKLVVLRDDAATHEKGGGSPPDGPDRQQCPFPLTEYSPDTQYFNVKIVKGTQGPSWNR